MKNYILKSLFYSACLALCMTACYEDLGNYDYTDINELEVDTFRTSYELVQFDTLKISPLITESLKKGEQMAYEWEVDHKVVSNDKDLAYQVDFVKSEVPIRFKVTNQNTGVSYFQYSELNATSFFSSGISLLHEINNNYACAFIRMAPDNPGIVIDSMFIRKGFEMGHAFSVHSSFYKDNLGTGYYMLCDTADNGDRRVTMFDVHVSQINQIKKKFVPTNIVEYDDGFQIITGFGGGHNQIHTRQDDAIFGNITYPKDVASAVCAIKMPHPFNPSFSLSGLIYMQRNSASNVIKYGRPWTTMMYPGMGAKIIKSVTSDMVACMNVNNNYQYLLVHDHSDGSGSLIKVQTSFMGGVAKFGEVVIPSGVFNSESKYQISGGRGCFFYTNGNTLFKANCEGDFSTTELFAVGAGSEISCIYATSSEDVLYVCAYDPSVSGTYKGSLYVISQEDGAVLDQYEHKTGRVIDMDFKKYSLEQSPIYRIKN